MINTWQRIQNLIISQDICLLNLANKLLSVIVPLKSFPPIRFHFPGYELTIVGSPCKRICVADMHAQSWVVIPSHGVLLKPP